MPRKTPESLSFLEYNVLLALADQPLHGYAVLRAIESQTDGSLTPRAGSLYRVLARLMSWGYVSETEPAEAEEPHPGLDRRYYELTRTGSNAVLEEARRLRHAADLAEQRLGIPR